MGMVKRRANIKAKVTVEEFDETKKLFLLDIKNAIHMDEIPPQLIINWDHTGINNQGRSQDYLKGGSKFSSCILAQHAQMQIHAPIDHAHFATYNYSHYLVKKH